MCRKNSPKRNKTAAKSAPVKWVIIKFKIERMGNLPDQADNNSKDPGQSAKDCGSFFWLFGNIFGITHLFNAFLEAFLALHAFLNCC
jgi:hypothetical protein